ncbi:DUF4145 domain-containing protein [Flavobacterium hauense]
MSDKVKTHCYHCNNETNQEKLLDEFELNPQEILQRNDEGDESQSMWMLVGGLWLVSKCLGCEKINFKHISRQSPDKSGDVVFYFPRKPIREIPYWVRKLPVKYLEIVHEIYVCVNEGLHILAVTGIRTLLDIFIVGKVGDVGSFKQKLNRLVGQGVITSGKANVLEALIEAGNASAHRGYKTDKETLFEILDIVENLLQSEIVDRSVNSIKGKVPPRHK